MKGGIFSQISAVREELPSSSRKVADFVLAHMNEIAGMTIHHLAEESGTSAAAVVRFCRALGLKGYPELRMRISADTARTDLKGYH
ncbi:MurR/RpiR family transcriptional regulator, partial [Exiguobacterium antarcticum]|nr:MurR/RpiR family transcriptional regulator [Exiguobacterium soli]